MKSARRLVSTLLAVLLFLPAASEAALHQVGPTRTKTTLQSILGLLHPGDVVEVDGDAVYPGGVVFQRDGASNAPITIRGLRINGRRPIISGTNVPSNSLLIHLRGDHYIFEGFELDAAYNPEVVRGIYYTGEDAVVRDTVVRNCSYHGIQSSDLAGSFMLDNVEVHHCGNGISYHQIYAASESYSRTNSIFRMQFCFVHDGNGGNNVKSRVARNEIYYNWIEGAYYHELDLIGADQEAQPGAANLVREDSDVVGNLLLKTPSSLGVIARLGDDGTGSSNGRYRFVNNTMILATNYSTYVLRLRGSRESVELHNNVFDRGGGSLQLVDSADPSLGVNDRVSGKNNFLPLTTTAVPAGITDSHTGSKPGFANEAAFDFRPGNGSLLLDSASLLTESPTNFPFINPLTAPQFVPPLRVALDTNPPVARADDGDPDIGAFGSLYLPPGFLTQPISVTKLEGQSAAFAVTASGSQINLNPLHYQWLHDDVAIDGATNTSFAIAAVQTNDAGNYRVVVTNVFGATTSNPALLVLTLDTNKPTVGITVPVNGATFTNGSITLTGTAKDTAPGVILTVKYRLWPETEFSSAMLSSGSTLSNWTTTNLTINPGTNIVHAYSVDGGGNVSAIKTNKFFYNSTNSLTVRIEGVGEVKSSSIASIANNQTIPLLVGRPYALTAFLGAGTNHVFTNWTDGDLTQFSTNLIYNFVMQSNLVLQANFITNPFTRVAGVYNGLFSETNGIRHQSAGFFTLTLSGKAGYSGKLYLDGDAFTISGKFDLSGRTIKTVSRATKGKRNLNLFLELDWSTSSEQIRGTLSEENWNAVMRGDRAIFNLSNPATGFAGASTFLVPRTNHPVNAPGGFGYGLVTNNLSGMITLNGALGDGTAVAQKVSISRNGEWPLFAQFYKSTNLFTNPTTGVEGTNKANYRGSLFGWMTFTNLAYTGELHWIKTGNAATNYFYPDGFTSVVEVTSSPYVAPGKGVRMLNVTDGATIFADGNLSGVVSNAIFVKTNNAVTILNTNNGLKITLTPKNGFFSGSFVHPNNLATTSFKGAVLQQQNYGGGSFAGTNQSGSVLLK